MNNSLAAKINSLKESYQNSSGKQPEKDSQGNGAGHEFSASTNFSPNTPLDKALSKSDNIFLYFIHYSRNGYKKRSARFII